MLDKYIDILNKYVDILNKYIDLLVKCIDMVDTISSYRVSCCHADVVYRCDVGVGTWPQAHVSMLLAAAQASGRQTAAELPRSSSIGARIDPSALALLGVRECATEYGD